MSNVHHLIEKNSHSRLPWIDALRGLAMLAILWAHTSASFILGFYEQWPYYDCYASRNYLICLLYLQSLLPPFFFIISGYLTAQSLAKQSYLSFIKKRLLRIGLPFLLGMILFIFPSEMIYMFAQLFPPSFWQHQQGFTSTQVYQQIHLVLAQQSVLSLLKFFDNTQVYWFLYYLLWYECLAPLLLKLIKINDKIIRHYLIPTNSRSYVTLLAILIALIATCLPTPPHLSLATPIHFLPDLTTFCEFALMVLFGMACFQYPLLLEKLNMHFDKSILFGIFIAFPLFYFSYLNPISYQKIWHKEFTWLCYNLFLWTTLLGTVAGFYRYFTKPQPILSYFSQATYWIYWIHLPVIISLQAYFADWVLNPIYKYPLLLFSATFLVLLPYTLIKQLARMKR